MSTNQINLQNPLQGRRWLRLLQADSECGYLLKQNLNVPKKLMGFSIQSNELGLRGPADQKATKVVFGTSFAMGIAVDNGKNWWELSALGSDWLNLGLAVGFNEWQVLLKRFHSGDKQKAIILYHPNFWMHCLMYERWRESGKDVFTALRWKRSWMGCAYLFLKKRIQRQTMLRSGGIVQFKLNEKRFEIDTRYCNLDSKLYGALGERNLQKLGHILDSFSEVKMIRLPIKNELVPSPYVNDQIRQSIGSYEYFWKATQNRFRDKKNYEFLTWNDARLEHYHELDTHWNDAGNQFFSEFFTEHCI